MSKQMLIDVHCPYVMRMSYVHEYLILHDYLYSRLKQVLQQNYSLPDICRVSRPHEAPGVLELRRGANLVTVSKYHDPAYYGNWVVTIEV